MSQQYETITYERAVRDKSPEHVARVFAGHVGQFYDRTAYDALAREVRGMYAARCPADAETFRVRLDRDLYGRYREPVDWRPAAVAEAA